jgi:ATP-dependent RNA helicase DDX51/DBP6
MEPFASAAGLSMAVVVGQTSMIAEQKKLVASMNLLQGGSSNVDILIATPGRLVDHLQMTPNFTLQHLQFLVIDEADRLLDQNFQDWLPKVLKSAEGKLPDGLPFAPVSDTVTFRENKAALDSIFGLNCWATPLRKMLFSATLTKNPAKLAQLKLNNPRFLSVSADHSKYTVPDELEEFMVVAEDGEKVHALLYLLQEKSFCRALCFTKSVDSTDKLCSLLQACMTNQTDRICSFSSDLSPAQRTQILEKFNLGEVDLLICSDGAARGLDLEQVSAVINYDVPIHVKTYIHRVGRTARAGASGVAFSLLESREAHHFKQMLVQGRSGKSVVQKLKIKPENIEPIRSVVEEAMNRLQGDLILQAVVQQFNRT